MPGRCTNRVPAAEHDSNEGRCCHLCCFDTLSSIGQQWRMQAGIHDFRRHYRVNGLTLVAESIWLPNPSRNALPVIVSGRVWSKSFEYWLGCMFAR